MIKTIHVQTTLMKTARISLLLGMICLLSGLCSCSQKVPQIPDGEYGMIAIPVTVTNTTQTKGLVFGYELTSTVDREVSIRIEPEVFEHFVFSNPLPPGSYYLNRMIGSYRNVYNTTSSTRNWTFKPTETIAISVQSGKISIPRAVIEINQFRDSESLFKTLCDIRLTSDKVHGEYIAELQSLKKNEMEIWAGQ